MSKGISPSRVRRTLAPFAAQGDLYGAAPQFLLVQEKESPRLRVRDDAVDANLRAADSDATRPINIGLGQEKSVLDIVDVLNSRVRSSGGRRGVELEEGLKRTLDSLRSDRRLRLSVSVRCAGR
jgi:nucleoside-diphosphate-sugar epimerase